MGITRNWRILLAICGLGLGAQTQTPAVVNLTPSTGGGATQTFTVTVTDTDGAADIDVVNLLINDALDGRSACYLAFRPTTATTGDIFLVRNAGDASQVEYLPMPGGGPGTVQNRQCSVTNTGSSLSMSGNTLTLSLNLTFKTDFGGNRLVYAAALDKGGRNSGWKARGAWAVPPPRVMAPAVVSMTPGRGTGNTGIYTFRFSDSTGIGNLAVANVLVNDFLDGRVACYVAYARAARVLYLVEDLGNAGALVGGVLGSNDRISNSQCSINLATSTAVESGNNLDLTLHYTFSDRLAGDRIFYLAARGADGSGRNSGWQPKGTVGYAATGLQTQLQSVTPNTARQGETVALTVTGVGTAFAVGAATASLGDGVTVNSVAVNSATSVTLNVTVGAGAALGSRNLTVTQGGRSFQLAGALGVVAAGGQTGGGTVVSRVTPGVGSTGTVIPVVITGVGTAFQQGTSVVSFGAGISAGPVTVTSPTQLSTTLTIAANATAGTRTVTVTTGTSVLTIADGFVVVGPQISLTSPADKSFVNTPSITVSGRVNDGTATVAVNGVAAPVTAGNFTVAIPLSEGNNSVTAVATSAGGATSSTSVLVNLDTTPPRVAVLSPAEGDETTEERINVAGNVNDIVVGTVNDVQAQVTVNGVVAEVSNRSFIARGVVLQPGVNTVQVVARDRVGNSITSAVRVNRVMAPLLRMSVVSGNNQSAGINTILQQPVVVQLTDGLGRPKANAPVYFQVTGNNGRVAPVTGGAGVLATEVRTDAQGQARAYWTLGSRSGAGINRLEASATGVTAPAVFTATGQSSAATRIVVDSGLNQTGAVGQPLPLPFVGVVIDEGNNRLGGVPVTLRVSRGGGTIGGQESVTVNSDPDGRVAVTLTLGPQEGQENNEVVGTFVGNEGNPAVFSASGLVPTRVQDTRVSGVVLDGSNRPVPGATIRLMRLNQGSASNLPIQVGASGVSGIQGDFALVGLPAGVFKLMVDGSTVTGPTRYPVLEFDVTLVAGRNNSLGTPVFLPALESNNQVCVDELTGGKLTLPSMPGFSLVIARGAATFPGGTKRGCVSVTPVNVDKVPMSPGFGQQPRFVVTIQPVGTTFNPPAELTIPNLDGLQGGSITEMYSYDHDLASFVSIGNGRVSADGRTIQSVEGAGVIKAGWHCGGNPQATGVIANCPTCQKCEGSGCVKDDLQSPTDSVRGDCQVPKCQNGSLVNVPEDSDAPTGQACCSGRPYDPSKECCAATAPSSTSKVDTPREAPAACTCPMPPGYGCCNGRPYDLAKEGCCGRGGAALVYDKSTQCCMKTPEDTPIFGGLYLPFPKNRAIGNTAYLESCPNRKAILPPESSNGCSNPLLGQAISTVVAAAIPGITYGSRDNPAGYPNTAFSNPAGTGPCDMHDVCYTTCASGNVKANQQRCDEAFHTGVKNVCQSAGLSPEQLENCLFWADRYKWAVSTFGENVYRDSMARVCQCCQ